MIMIILERLICIPVLYFINGSYPKWKKKVQHKTKQRMLNENNNNNSTTNSTRTPFMWFTSAHWLTLTSFPTNAFKLRIRCIHEIFWKKRNKTKQNEMKKRRSKNTKLIFCVVLWFNPLLVDVNVCKWNSICFAFIHWNSSINIHSIKLFANQVYSFLLLFCFRYPKNLWQNEPFCCNFVLFYNLRLQLRSW